MSKKLIGKARQRERKKNRTRNGNGVSVQSNGEGKEMSWEMIKETLNSYSQQPNSTMIHENDYLPMNCVICGSVMNSIHDTHNPQPITDKCYAKEALEEGKKDRCCSYCDMTVVLPTRLASVGANPEMLSKAYTKLVRVEDIADSVSWDAPFRKM